MHRSVFLNLDVSYLEPPAPIQHGCVWGGMWFLWGMYFGGLYLGVLEGEGGSTWFTQSETCL